MGKGTIIGGGGEDNPRYDLAIDLGTGKRNSLIESIERRILTLAAYLDEQEAEKGDLDAKYADALIALDAAIAQLQAVDPTDTETREAASAIVRTTTAAVQDFRGSLDLYEQNTGKYKAEKKSLELRLAELEALPTVELQSAWCADYREELTGQVATIEVTGEGGNNVIIVPEGRAPTDDDGFLEARNLQSGAADFYNAALLPGVQRHRPIYRIGVVSNLDEPNDLCTVTLDNATSSAQDLPINYLSVLDGVPIEYMSCNAGAFTDGDRVVVQFVNNDWYNPKVIGFESNPRKCGPRMIWVPIGMHYPVLVPGNYVSPYPEENAILFEGQANSLTQFPPSDIPGITYRAEIPVFPDYVYSGHQAGRGSYTAPTSIAATYSSAAYPGEILYSQPWPYYNQRFRQGFDINPSYPTAYPLIPDRPDLAFTNQGANGVALEGGRYLFRAQTLTATEVTLVNPDPGWPLNTDTVTYSGIDWLEESIQPTDGIEAATRALELWEGVCGAVPRDVIYYNEGKALEYELLGIQVGQAYSGLTEISTTFGATLEDAISAEVVAAWSDCVPNFVMPGLIYKLKGTTPSVGPF